MIEAFYRKTYIDRLYYFNDDDYNKFCCVIINILCLPWNILVFSVSIAISLPFAVVAMIFVMPQVVYKTTR